jgi:phosphopantetheine adenylyltransferase
LIALDWDPAGIRKAQDASELQLICDQLASHERKIQKIEQYEKRIVELEQLVNIDKARKVPTAVFVDVQER